MTICAFNIFYKKQLAKIAFFLKNAIKLRLLFLLLLVYGIGTGLIDGWLIIKWSQLLHDVGFTEVDRDKPINWNDFVIKRLEKEK